MMSVFNVGVATFSSNTTIRDDVGTELAAKAVDIIVVEVVVAGNEAVNKTNPSPPPGLQAALGPPLFIPLSLKGATYKGTASPPPSCTSPASVEPEVICGCPINEEPPPPPAVEGPEPPPPPPP